MFLSIMIQLYKSNYSQHPLTIFLVQVETVHLQKENNLSQSSTVTGQEPEVRHLDMMSWREGGGVEEEEASERKKGDAADED